MKSIRLFSLALICALLTACGNNASVPGEIPSTTAEPGKPADVFGIYEGVLPCEGCKGIRTALELKADSTYIIRELAITDTGGTDLGSFKGKFVSSGNGGKLLLKDVSNRDYRWFESGDMNSLYPMDKEGNARIQNAEPLKRMSFLSASRENFSVFELTPSEKRYPAIVFQQAQGADVIIDKNYLSSAAEIEKAVAALYARLYSAGCDAMGCVLEESLGKDALNLADVYFKGDTPVMQELSAGKKGTLQALVVIVSSGKIRTQYSYTDAEGKIRNFMDEFAVAQNALSRVKSQEIDSTRQRSVKGIQSHTSGPQDASERQKIIDAKAAEKKK